MIFILKNTLRKFLNTKQRIYLMFTEGLTRWQNCTIKS
jgi:hypothetical protein